MALTMAATACRHYRTGEVMILEDGALRAPVAGERAETDLLIAPALVDLQINGYKGVAFDSDTLTVEEVKSVFDEMAAVGTAYFAPTVVTSSPAVALHGLRTLRAACERYPEVADACVGFHLEGPYIASEDGPRGAHPREYARDPDWDEFQRFQDAAGGRVVIVTLAPECDGALPFIERLAAAGIVAAIGHAAPTTEQTAAAAAAGARMVTHLGNGAHAMLPRHPNYLWDFLADDRLSASLIVDGFHLAPNVVKVAVRAKGLRRTILVSDIFRYSGFPPGVYPLDDNRAVEVAPNGRIGLHGTPLLAGANTTVDHCVANAVAFAGLDPADAIDLASVNAWRMLGKEPPAIAPGAPARGVMLCRWQNGRLAIEQVMR